MVSRKVCLASALATVALVLPSRLIPARADKDKVALPAAGGTTIPAAMLAGSASCAGRACHGGSEPASKLIQQDEYSTWLGQDRHARAYAVLLGDRGRGIGLNLGTVAHED